MEWTLLIIVSISGVLSADMKFLSIPMKTKPACIAAMDGFAANSKGVGIFCVGSETGEIVRRKL